MANSACIDALYSVHVFNYIQTPSLQDAAEQHCAHEIQQMSVRLTHPIEYGLCASLAQICCTAIIWVLMDRTVAHPIDDRCCASYEPVCYTANRWVCTVRLTVGRKGSLEAMVTVAWYTPGASVLVLYTSGTAAMPPFAKVVCVHACNCQHGVVRGLHDESGCKEAAGSYRTMILNTRMLAIGVQGTAV